MDVFIALLWLLMAGVAGEFASKKGRGFLTWMLISLLLSPLFGLAAIAVLPVSEDGLLRTGRFQQCGRCLSLVPIAATACRNCGAELAGSVAEPEAKGHWLNAEMLLTAGLVTVILYVGYAWLSH